jgi:hypothetical protein
MAIDVHTVSEFRTSFTDPPADCRPLMRWWWFGPDVERHELARQLAAMRDAGLGGVEVAVVYPMSQCADRYLSDTFLADLRFAAEEASRLGLRFDLTVGSGWPYGGPHITPDLAARRLHWEQREIGIDAVEIPAPISWPDDELVAAYVGTGARPSVSWEPLPIVGGEIRVPEGRGPRVLLVAVSRLTGQHVKRAAAGAEGLVLDHYSAAATARHIEAVGERLLAAVSPELVGDVFCDSLEVYGSDWTPTMVEEFRARRGYDPLPLLWLLHAGGKRLGDNKPGDASAGRFRADYYRTLTELCEENFIAPMRRWAAGHGTSFRIQAYGQPPVGLSSYRHADVPEGEGPGWKDISSTRWASSAAQIYGRAVVSSEIWTWVHSPSFRATPLDLKGEAHEYLLSGVNQFIGHGWPYSPRSVDGLGWIFYAAGALDDRNPWWSAAVPLNRYLQRLSWLTRQGERIADVGVYAPYRAIYAGFESGTGRTLDLWRGTRDHIGFDLTKTVREAGFDFDLFDDEAVEVLDPARFPVVVLPYVDDLPDQTLSWLESVHHAGGHILAVGGVTTVGNQLASVRDLADALHAGATPDVILSPPCPDVGTVHRRVGDIDIYLIVNTGPETVEFECAVRNRHAHVERWEPMNGATLGRIPEWPVPLTLEAYEATVLVAHDGDASPVASGIPGRSSSSMALSGWSVRFDGDATAVPVELPHRWEDDAGRRQFSGGATYTTAVVLDELPAEAWLDLGAATPVDHGLAGERGMIRHLRGQAYLAEVLPPVGEIAEVTVNGKDAGILWSPPYRLSIGHQLRAGANDIEIRVSNTAANALSADPGVVAEAEEAKRRYGHRFDLQDIDRATDDVNSGLLAAPRLLVRR